MTLIVVLLLTGWAATIAALFMLTHTHEKRINTLLDYHAAERGTPNPDTVALIAFAERMAQRIQAPEQAVVDHSIQQPLPPSPAAILPDDDTGWWSAQESKESLAEALMAAETNG